MVKKLRSSLWALSVLCTVPPYGFLLSWHWDLGRERGREGERNRGREKEREREREGERRRGREKERESEGGICEVGSVMAE